MHSEAPVDFFEQPLNAAEEREAEKRVAEEHGQISSSNNAAAARERVVWCINLCESFGELAFSLNALKQSGLKLLPYDLPHIFKKVDEPYRALTFYRWIKSEPHLTLGSETYDVLVKMLCERKQFGSVWSLLADMKNEKPAVPDFIFMTIITTCCCKARNPAEAAHFFNSMPDYRCKPSGALYNCLLEGFLRCSATKLAQKYMDKMVKERFQVSEANQQLLATTLVKTELEALADRIVANQVEATAELCCDTVIKLCKAHNEGQALGLFKFMACRGFQPTSEVAETLTKHLAEAERSNDAMIAFKLLAKMNVPVTYLTCAWVASSLIMDLELSKAQRVLKYVRSSRLRKGVKQFVEQLTHATLMKAVWDLLRFMKYSGYQPDRKTYMICVKAANAACKRSVCVRDVCSAGGSSTMLFPCNLLLKMLAFKNHRYTWPLVRFMQSKGVSPNQYSYSKLIQAYFRGDQMELAWEAYAEMRKQAMLPLRWAYPYLVCDAAKAGKSELPVELFEEMINEWGLPSPPTSKKLIVWLCYHGSSDVALKLYRELKARGAILNSSLRILRCLRRVKTVHTRELLNEIDEDIVHRNLVKSKLLTV